MRKIFTFFAAMLVAASMVADPVVLPDTLDVDNVSFRSEGMPNYVIAEGTYAGTYFDMGAHDDATDTLLYAEWNVTIEKKKYNVEVDVYNPNGWSVQLYLLNQTGDTLKALRYVGPWGKSGNYTIGTLDLSNLEAGNYKVRVHAATAHSQMKLKNVIFTVDYKGVRVALPGTLQPIYAELSSGASVSNNAIAFTPSTANKEYATWNVSFATAGSYKVSINYTASNTHSYSVALRSADGTTKVDSLGEAATWAGSGDKELGSITVPTAGNYLVKLTNGTQHSEAVLNSIKFTAPSKPVTDIDLDEDELSLDVNETGFLHATVLPVDASDPSVTWTSSDPTVATVTNGAVKALKAGTTTITATAGLISDVCSVTVSDAIPSTDFASSYFFMGTKAKLEGDIFVSEADSLSYPDKRVKGTASWKIDVTTPCYIGATANYKTGSASGAKLQIVILNENDAQVGDTLKQGHHESDGDVVIPGSILLPKAGVYTIKLLNAQEWSHAKLRGITLTKTADVPSIQMYGGWDSWLAPRNLTISDDGLSASTTISLDENNQPEFKIKVNGEWRANGWYFYRSTGSTNVNLDSDGDNMKFISDMNGTYTVTWQLKTNTLSVAFPALPEALEDGWYLIGTFNEVNEWQIYNLTAAKKFAVNPDNNDEYYIVKDLKSGDQFKAVYVYQEVFQKDSYKPSDGNYIVTAGQAGDAKAIYFRETYYSEWSGHFYITDSPSTSLDNVLDSEKTVKAIENGQLVIIKNGVRYNVLGTVVR